MRLISWGLAIIVLGGGGDAQAAGCVGLLSIPGVQKELTLGTLPSLQEKARAGGAACGSFVSVLDKVIKRNKTAGRRLEGEKPLNVGAAQANVDAALRDPEIRKQIQALRRVPDENLRLLYEAAIFDEEGYYNARELRIQQLLQRLK